MNAAADLRRVAVFGATGSIGASTLDVIARHPHRYQATVLAAGRQVQALLALCRQHKPAHAVIADASLFAELRDGLREAGLATEAHAGQAALDQLAASDACDTVVAAIVGAAGLSSTLAAAAAGKRILLANKESLVLAGELLTRTAERAGAEIIPIDSEHSAIFQCLRSRDASVDGAGVRRILLTASGGPFRETPLDQLSEVSPEQACAHPNWSMGRKISVDSASMMNKGLELIEACWLFDAPPSKVEVVIHPQSVIHSLVDYVDGSVLAQLGNPDMRTPIAHALAWPERIDSGVSPLDLFGIARLDFQAPDEQRFPCLRLARQAAEAGGSAPAMLNAANEVAVAAFLERRIRFTEIAVIIDEVLNREAATPVESLDVVLEADRRAREAAQAWLHGRGR